MKRPKIKICGITNLIDAKNALNLGADYIGFVNIERSKRYITDDDIRVITSQLSEQEVEKAVLLTDMSRANDIDELARYLEIRNLQPYSLTGYSSVSTLKAVSYKIFMPIAIASEEDLKVINEYEALVEYLILDSKTAEGESGGSGETFDWSLFTKARDLSASALALAGGLGPENIREAIELCQPDMVDLSSSLESSPGIKSLDKMKSFFAEISTLALG